MLERRAEDDGRGCNVMGDAGSSRARTCEGVCWVLGTRLGTWVYGNLCIVPATAARGAATGKPRAVGMTCFRRCYLTVQTAVTNVASDWALTGQ